LIAATDEEGFKKVSKTIFPWFVSNHHLHRIPATAITALEMKLYGKEYASQIVRNARRLAEELAALGMKVLGEAHGYTRSHQVLVDVRELGGGAKVAVRLEEAGIIVNKNLLPYDPPEAVKDPSGIRLGVQEITRLGMKESDMAEVARLLYEAASGKKDPNEIRKHIKDLRSQFSKIHYALPEELASEAGYVDILNLLR